MNPDSYVGIIEASKFLGVSSVTVRKWVKNGDLKSLKVKSNKNGREMYVIHDKELEFFKQNILPNIYHRNHIPKEYKRTFTEKLWERIKSVLRMK